MFQWNRTVLPFCIVALAGCRQAPRIADGSSPPARVVAAADPIRAPQPPLPEAGRDRAAAESISEKRSGRTARGNDARDAAGRVELAGASAARVQPGGRVESTRAATGSSLLRMAAHQADEPVPDEPLPVETAPMVEPGVFPPAPPMQAVGAFTLVELESMALQRNPSIRQASAVAYKAMGTRTQVGLCPNPTVGYMGQEIFDNGTYGQQGFQAEQTWVRGDKLQWNQRVLDQEVQALQWQVEAQRQRVLTDVRRQFYETLGAQERVRLTQELEDISAEAADNARILVENAQGARPDLLQAEVQFNEIAILRRQAEFEHEASWRQLANLVGSPDLPLAELDHVLDVETGVRDWDLVRQQLSGSPQLMQAYAEAQRARTLVSRAEVQPIPNVEFQVGAMQMAESDHVGLNLQIGVPLPLFNKNQGNIDRAWCEVHRAQWNAQRLQLSLQAQLAAAFGDYRDAANRVATYRDQIVPRQRESLELIELGYPAQFDYLRLWTARRGYYEARIDSLNAVVDLRQAEVLIDGLMLTGGLNNVEDTSMDDSLRGAALSGQ